MCEKIENIDFGLLNNGAYFTFHDGFSSKVGQKDARTMGVGDEFGTYRVRLVEGKGIRRHTLDKMKKVNGWEIGEKRKKVFDGLINAFNAFCDCTPLTEDVVVGPVGIAREKCKKVRLKPYRDQTGEMRTLVEELRGDNRRESCF